jgi:alkylated DNA repair dioxygenase AlkB
MEYLDHRPGTLPVSKSDFEGIYDFMKNRVAKTPNPRNRNTFLKRKQCTFVTPNTSDYIFAGQDNEHFVDDWPPIVSKALEQVKAMEQDPWLYTAVHVNLYEDGGVGVEPHQDNEKNMVQEKSIYSYTLLQDESTPRDFSLYTLHANAKNKDNEKVVDVSLGHGDLLIMKAGMQTRYKHGIGKVRPYKRYKPRINLTVRALKSVNLVTEITTESKD